MAAVQTSQEKTKLQTEQKQDIAGREKSSSERRNNRRKTEEEKRLAAVFRGRACDAARLGLLAAAGLTAVFENPKNAAVIAGLLTAEAAAGLVRERKCMRDSETIRRLAEPAVKLRRGGEIVDIDRAELKEGDLFEMSEGDLFPCDCMILEQTELTCDESLLTGDHTPAVKTAYSGEEITDKLGLIYIGYSGTAVLTGTAVCRAMGHGSEAFRRSLPERPKGETTVTESRKRAGRWFTGICVAAGAVTAAAGILRGSSVLNMITLSLTAAAVCIPDSPEAAAELTSARLRRLLMKKGTLVLDTAALERLGSTEILLADSRSIVTERGRTVKKLCIPADIESEYDYSDVTGRLTAGRSNDGYMAWENAALSEAMICAAVCCRARKVRVSEGKKRDRRTYYEGDTDDAALLSLCSACGIDRELLLLSKLSEKSFDPADRYSSVTCKGTGGEIRVYYKGVPEKLLPMCGGVYEASPDVLRVMARRAEQMAADGLSVVALCETVGGETLLLGLAGFHSPIPPTAPAEVRSLRRSGVRTIMLTDDERATARAVAGEAGILSEGSRCCTGEELDAMTDVQLTAVSGAVSVYARTEPRHKARLAQIFGQANNGEICGAVSSREEAALLSETNALICAAADSPETVLSAAEVILPSRGMGHIAGAVRCGKAYHTALRGQACLNTAFAAAVMVLLMAAAVCGMKMPISAVQLLTAAILTEPACTAALTVIPDGKKFAPMPRVNSSDRPFIGRGLMGRYLAEGIVTALSVLCCFAVELRIGTFEQAQTGTAAALALSRLMTLSGICTTEKLPKRSAAAIMLSAAALAGVISVPAAAAVFGFTRLTPAAMLAAAGFALLPTAVRIAVKK